MEILPGYPATVSSLLIISVFLVGLSGSVLAADGSLPGSGDLNDPYLIEDIADFDAFASDPSYWAAGVHTKLMCDPNLSGRTCTTAVIAPDTDNQNYEFDGTSFAGIFDGNGHNIHKLTIDPNGSSNHYLGLFGYVVNAAVIKNLGVENVSITGGDNSRYLGGLCGGNGGNISNCYSSGPVSGGVDSYYLGGLCGMNLGTISGCSATGSVTGGYTLGGGLCGSNSYGSNISNCSATCSVTGGDDSGGIGGLCGINRDAIRNCYATGSISGDDRLGALCGYSDNGTISNCYATGNVTGDITGGLIGYNRNGSYSACFWDITVDPNLADCGYDYDTDFYDVDLTGVFAETTVNMQDPNTFITAGWDFVSEVINGANDIWDICDGTNYPKLSWQIPLSGDFVCPDDVEMNDLDILIGQWLFEEKSMDLAPDGVVDFLDWAVLADGWQVTYFIDELTVFAEQWLKTGATYYIADIAPPPDGDGKVNLLDFALFAEHWLEGTSP